MSSLRQLLWTVRALHHRNFRLFYMGQSISLIGTWMQRIALGWLVYRLTDSVFLLGLVGFVGQIPGFLLAPLAGVLADRWDRHRMLLVTQAIAMAQALVLAILVLTNAVTIWHILALSLVLGIINSFDIPTRQSFTVEMLEDKRDLANAIALNSSMVNGARLLGPSVAGVLIAAVGEGVCFLLNGLSYLAVLASLLLMQLGQRKLPPRRSGVWHELGEGFRYAFRFPPIRDLLLMVAMISLMGMPYAVLMPAFVRDVLSAGPGALGFLMGAVGAGALMGALYLASRRDVLGLDRLIPLAAAALGCGLMAFSFSPVLWLSLPLMLVVGIGQMLQMASSNTLLQTMVDDDKRGRIMSFYVMAFMGMAPVGSLIAGSVASKIGAPWTVFLAGAGCTVAAAVFAKRLPALRDLVRPVYVAKEILPETAQGTRPGREREREVRR
ncbi:MFS transporter [Candidatus Fermentibacteria bacterium]|nr:MFS transporter [Candidatus Fermentibacteria bacterium]